MGERALKTQRHAIAGGAREDKSMRRKEEMALM
jgi:hypothetical protein